MNYKRKGTLYLSLTHDGEHIPHVIKMIDDEKTYTYHLAKVIKNDRD